MKINYWIIPGLKKFSSEEKSDRIIHFVCNVFETTRDKIIVQRRFRQLVNVRFTCAYFLKQETDLTWWQIANLLGYNNHTSAIHACATIQDILDTNQPPSALINYIKTRIKSV